MKTLFRTSALGAVLALAVAACGQDADQAATTPPPAAPASDPAATTAPNLEDAARRTAAFAGEAAQSDMLGLELAKLAQQKSASAEVKDLAATLTGEHTRTSAELATWAGGANVQLPTALASAQQSNIDNLRAADAKGFDDKYLDIVIDQHEDAVEAFQDYSEGGGDLTLKSWASSTLPGLRGRLETANALRKTVNKTQ